MEHSRLAPESGPVRPGAERVGKTLRRGGETLPREKFRKLYPGGMFPVPAVQCPRKKPLPPFSLKKQQKLLGQNFAFFEGYPADFSPLEKGQLFRQRLRRFPEGPGRCRIAPEKHGTSFTQSAE